MEMKRRTRRRKLLLILFPCAVVFAFLFGICYGSVSIPLPELWRIFASASSGTDSAYTTIAVDLRLPRVLIGLLVGACLAVSGALLQGVMRNPLADPGIIGISTGGGTAAVVTMIMFPAFGYLLPLTAFAGAFLTSAVIYALAWDKGASPLKIILAGVAINALLGAIQSGVMVLYSERVQSVLPWLSGGLNGRSWYHLSFILPYAIVGLALALAAIRPANMLLLGDESAKLLGQKVEFMRFALIMLSALLAGTAVSVAGLVGFVGLVVPHAVRLLIGDDYRYLLPLSMLGGGALVVIADTIARTAFDPLELPVGILLACLGAPFFLILLKKRGLI